MKKQIIDYPYYFNCNETPRQQGLALLGVGRVPSPDLSQ